MTAEQILKEARELNPTIRYARHKDGTAVAGWATSLGRWQIVLVKLPDGRWVQLSGELLIDGKPSHNEPEDWIE